MNSTVELALLRQLADRVEVMRTHQRAWFTGRQKPDLGKSKQLEREVDGQLRRLRQLRDHPSLLDQAEQGGLVTGENRPAPGEPLTPADREQVRRELRRRVGCTSNGKRTDLNPHQFGREGSRNPHRSSRDSIDARGSDEPEG